MTLIALPCLSVFTKSNFWKYYQELYVNSRNAMFSPKTSDILESMNNLIGHAYNEVHFYHDRMKAIGIKPGFIQTLDDFLKFPITTKNDIDTNFPDRITASKMDSSSWQYSSTSGTIQRMAVIQDFEKRDFVRATQLIALSSATCYELGMKYMEIPPNVCANVCGVSNTLEPKILNFFFENLVSRKLFDKDVMSDFRGLVERQFLYRRKELSSFDPEGTAQKKEALDEYIKAINNYKPYVLKAVPIYLYLLANHIIEMKLNPPKIKCGLMPMGGSMTPYMKQVVESAFNTRVHEDYGCAEVGGIAAECFNQNGLHPFSKLFHVEVVRHHLHVGHGEIGKVLITDLCNYSMPLIRYDIGDVAVFYNDKCKCGITSPRIVVQGKIQDCLLGINGEIITHDTLVDTFLRRDDITSLQVEMQNEDEIFVNIVPAGSNEPDILDIKQTLSRMIKGNPTVSTRVVPTILPEPGGKFRFVKNYTEAINDAF